MRTYLAACLIVLALSQNIGHEKAEFHLPLAYEECTSSGCQSKKGSITMDENWRWLHSVTGYTNCYTGSQWDKTLCPDPTTCTKNCAIDGVPAADWINPYGVRQTTNGIQMTLVTHGQYGDNVGSRAYLLETDDKYKIFKLNNKEFSFDVDVSKLECGINGALYFVEMQVDGGASKYPGNKAGAKYGTGYCDAQCPHDVKFIYGEANSKDWKNGQGHYGSCCAEFDVWEANKAANAYTAHPCKIPGYHRCQGTQCGDGAQRQNGICDKDGCDMSPYRNGNKNFYGAGSSFKVDTTKPFKVVTQFITSDNTDNGDLIEVKRFYVQGGKKFDFPNTNVSGLGTYNSMTNQNCGNQKRVFAEPPTFQNAGGLKAMGDAFKRGMVLVLSLWDDHESNMLWLDSDFPLDKDPKLPGVGRGPCSRTSGKPSDVEKLYPGAYVDFKNIKFGTHGSTVTFEDDGITVKADNSLQAETQ